MNRRTLVRFLVGLGIACLLWVVWSQRPLNVTDREPSPTASTESSHAESTGAGTAVGDDHDGPLLDPLQQLMDESDQRTREALLTFNDDAAIRRFLDRAAASGLEVVDRIDALRTVRVRYDTLADLQRDWQQNAGDYAELSGNALMRIPSAPARENRAARDEVPFGNDTLAFLGAEADRSTWGRGVTIAIIDSGVAPDVTFDGRLRRLDIGRGLNPGRDEGAGHGTSVAALAAGVAPDAAGVAPAADILSIRVTDANGVSDVFTVAQAIVAAVDAGAQVLNISLGGHSTNGTLNAAIGYATDRGALIVAAAGNDQAARLAWPAADARVVSVGAVDKSEQQVAFSNSGPQLNLTAPGYGVQTAWLDGQRAYVDGTSASAPLVAGSIAAVVSQNPSLSPQQAAELLRTSATDAGAPGADPAYGGGILNLAWAMNRQTPGYVDPAISSHYFDAEQGRMQFVVQNRSSYAMTGLSLDVTTAGVARRVAIPSLAAGESFVVNTPVPAAALKPGANVRITTQLSVPAGVIDRVPANNRRSSVLTAPAE